MSTLFGHRAGAFTGAVKARADLLKGADSGVLFLDEIGELGPDGQTMLQLNDVLQVCAESTTLSQAGRQLFAVSRTQRKSANDANRLRKDLARFGLDFAMLKQKFNGEHAP